MKIKGFDFLLTFKCPAKCAHCTYRAGPEREGKMTVSQGVKYLEILKEYHPVEWFTIHGGEPCLYFNDLIKLISKARKLQIARIGIITNSFWAENLELAKKKIQKLKDAGLTHITFSVDAFHQKFIHLKSVKNAIQSTLEVGFDRLNVDTYYINSITTPNEHNLMNEEYLREITKFEEVEISRYSADLEGRAADTIIKDIEKTSTVPSGKCKLPFWIGGDLKNPTTIEIDHSGNVTLCPGICIGNAEKECLNIILDNYDYSKHPIISVLEAKGPIGLLELAKTKNYDEEKKSFFNECHLCYEIRRFLQPHYPEFLAPKGCYSSY